MAAWNQSRWVWTNRPLLVASRSPTRRICLPDLPTSLKAPEGTRDLSSCVPPLLITVYTGTGISTGCPSATPRGLALGPTNPRRTNLASEPWGVRWGGFSPPWRYSCRHSRFRPLQPCSRSTFPATRNAPLPSLFPRIHSFGDELEPRWIIGARPHLTSELLRTLSRVAASKPTSWLSLHSNIVYHLASTWGP